MTVAAALFKIHLISEKLFNHQLFITSKILTLRHELGISSEKGAVHSSGNLHCCDLYNELTPLWSILQFFFRKQVRQMPDKLPGG